jgi:hypothetical protein
MILGVDGPLTREDSGRWNGSTSDELRPRMSVILVTVKSSPVCAVFYTVALKNAWNVDACRKIVRPDGSTTAVITEHGSRFRSNRG